MFTHFATSDEKNLSFTYSQLKTFNTLLSALAKNGVRVPIVHAANSAATLRVPSAHYDLVRPGVILYGLAPSGDFPLPFIPKPVMALKTKIVQLRQIAKGETVGYGRTFTAVKPTRVASLTVGYADGFRRAPNNWGSVLVNGQFAPLIGRVSMDQSSIDVTAIRAARVGDEVVLIGIQGKHLLTAELVAKTLGTINYEVTSAIASRVSRVYFL